MKSRNPTLMSDLLENPPETRGALPFKVPLSAGRTRTPQRKPPPNYSVSLNLLGADLTVTNFGGGNTSAKLDAFEPAHRPAGSLLWVKGSAGDLGSMKLMGFATLYLERILHLEAL